MKAGGCVTCSFCRSFPKCALSFVCCSRAKHAFDKRKLNEIAGCV